MKHLVVAALLVVVLDFYRLEPFDCPATAQEVQAQQDTVSRNQDGTYSRPSGLVSGVNLVMRYCAHRWQEEWTETPDNGGHYIRGVPGSDRWSR